MLGLDIQVLAQLHTFGKALGSRGGQFYFAKLVLILMSFVVVLVTSTLIWDYMINYAWSFIFTTFISHANIIAEDSPFDLLEWEALKPVSPFQNIPIIVVYHI